MQNDKTRRVQWALCNCSSAVSCKKPFIREWTLPGWALSGGRLGGCVLAPEVRVRFLHDQIEETLWQDKKPGPWFLWRTHTPVLEGESMVLHYKSPAHCCCKALAAASAHLSAPSSLPPLLCEWELLVFPCLARTWVMSQEHEPSSLQQFITHTVCNIQGRFQRHFQHFDSADITLVARAKLSLSIYYGIIQVVVLPRLKQQ